MTKNEKLMKTILDNCDVVRIALNGTYKEEKPTIPEIHRNHFINLYDLQEYIGMMKEVDERPVMKEIKELQETIKEYCRKLRMDYYFVMQKSRKREVTIKRHFLFYIIKKNYNVTLADIGRAFGGTDHSTVIHGIENVEYAISKNEPIYKKYLAILEDNDN